MFKHPSKSFIIDKLKLEPYTKPYAKVGRNHRCPCGSGLKFKACCIDK